jgi:tetratricopeptide (TPR) repeat protein
MQQTGTNFTQYINLYNNQWKDLMQSQEEGGILLPEYDRSIWTTWMISFETIRGKSAAAADLLLLWAFLDNRDLWYGLFDGIGEEDILAAPTYRCTLQEIYRNEVAFNGAIRLLLNYCLVEKMENPAGYVVHPVVHRWARHVQNEEQRCGFARLAVIIIGFAVPSSSERDFWITRRRLLGHAECCFEWVDTDSIKILRPQDGCTGEIGDSNLVIIPRALLCLGNHNLDQGKLEQAETMYQLALQGCEKALGKEHPITLGTVNNLGNLHTNQGKLDEAETMYQQALQGFEKALGKEHTSTLDTVNNLGNLYRGQGKLNKAETMLQRALQGYEKALGKEHTLTLDAVNNLGNLYGEQGKLEQAETMYRRALQGYEKAPGKEHLSTLETVNNLGVVYVDQGKLEQAEIMYQWALQGYEKALGKEHTSTLSKFNNLGVVYTHQGKLEQAETMYRRALQGYEKALSADLLATNLPALIAYQNLAQLLLLRGRPKEAKEFSQRALVGLRKVLGPSHEQCGRLESAFASIHLDLGMDFLVALF